MTPRGTMHCRSRAIITRLPSSHFELFLSPNTKEGDIVMTGNEHYFHVAVPSDQTGRRTFLIKFLAVGAGLVGSAVGVGRVGSKSLQFKNIDSGTGRVCGQPCF